MTNFICGICGTKHTDLDSYLKCVSKCVETMKAAQKAEEEKEKLEKMNASLNGVKQAKLYYEEQLEKFKKEYPAEYKLNFGKNDKCSNDTCKCSQTSAKSETIELSYENNGKDKPKMSAKVNGKEVNDAELKSLLEDPETKFIAQMLGLI